MAAGKGKRGFRSAPLSRPGAQAVLGADTFKKFEPTPIPTAPLRLSRFLTIGSDRKKSGEPKWSRRNRRGFKLFEGIRPQDCLCSGSREWSRTKAPLALPCRHINHLLP